MTSFLSSKEWVSEIGSDDRGYVMSNAFSIRLEPEDLEERFRLDALERDRTQAVVVLALVVVIITGFIALDLRLLQSSVALQIATASRCVAAIVALVAIWMIRRLSSARSFDRIVLVFAMVHICHMLIVNALRPTDYVAVIVWDVITIFGIYLVLPAPLHVQILLALLLTGGGGVLWLMYRPALAGAYETVAVLAAYCFPNAFGIFVSRLLHRSRRQQFVLLTQERKARKELETALAEVKTLRGIIPICSYCGKIRNDEGYYEAVEEYIMEHSDAVFSHTYCPECFAKYYPHLQLPDEE
jgi:hypothetical protein